MPGRAASSGVASGGCGGRVLTNSGEFSRIVTILHAFRASLTVPLKRRYNKSQLIHVLCYRFTSMSAYNIVSLNGNESYYGFLCWSLLLLRYYRNVIEIKIFKSCFGIKELFCSVYFSFLHLQLSFMKNNVMFNVNCT